MQVPTVEVTCDVCGGVGTLIITQAHLAWRADIRIQHENPAICKENKEKKRREKSA